MPEPSTAAPPAAVRLQADPAWRTIDFIADLHLSAERPRSFDAWTRYLAATPADAVFLLGDVFELWVGDDARLAAGSFEARCAAALREAGQRRWLGFMAGNRDFLVGDELLAECGVTPLPDPTLLVAFGHPLLLSHGDALCLADRDYQRFRAEVRSEAFQQSFLARPLDERRRIARGLRDASQQQQRDATAGLWSEVDDDATAQWLRAAGAWELVHGHTHRPADHRLPSGHTRHVLADWEFDDGAVRGDVLRLTRAGLQRLPVSEVLGPAA